MVFLRPTLTASLAVFSSLGSVQTASLIDRLKSLSPPARDVLRRATPAAPHFVAYSDKYVSPEPTVTDINVSQSYFSITTH